MPPSKILSLSEPVLEVIFLLVVFLTLRGAVLRAGMRLVGVAQSEAHREFVGSLSRSLAKTLVVLMIAGCLACLGVNAWLLFVQRVDLLAYKLSLLRSIPAESWRLALRNLLGFAGLFFCAIVVRWPLHRAIVLLCASLCRLPWVRFEESQTTSLARILCQMVTWVTYCYVLLIGLDWLGLHSLRRDHSEQILLLVTLPMLVRAAQIVLGVLVDSLQFHVQALLRSRQLAGLEPIFAHALPLLRSTLGLALWMVALHAAMAQLPFPALSSLTRFLPVTLLALATYFGCRVLGQLAVLAGERLLSVGSADTEAVKRRRTLGPLFGSGLRYLVYFMGALIVMNQLGINPLPILAGAGIAGLALGIGAQSLIGDLVAGFFVLFESHYLIGDWVSLGDHEGEVESISFRSTVIRDPAGKVHILRNGQIHCVVNFSNQFVNALIEIGVAYDTDLDRAFAVLIEAGRWVAAHSPDVTKPLWVDGVQRLDESAIIIRTRTRVAPGRSHPVERMTRKRILELFAEHKIQIPFPHRQIVLQAPREPVARA